MLLTHQVQTICDSLIEAAATCPEKEFIVFSDQRRSYGQIHERALTIARSLMALGVEPRDRIGVLLPNCVEFAELYFGILYAGATIAPINTRFKSRELEYVCRHSRIKMLLTSDLVDEHTNFTDLLDLAIPELVKSASGTAPYSHPELRHRVLFGDKQHLSYIGAEQFLSLGKQIEVRSVANRLMGVAVRAPAVLFYTSGTTAMPKACVLTHEVFMRQAAATVARLRFQADERMWLPLPMFHSSATQTLFSMLCCRGTWISTTYFEPASSLRQITEEKVTTMFPAFPTIIQQMLNHPDYDESSFRHLRTTFNVANPDLLRQMQKQMPQTIQVGGFGMTETAGSVTINSLDEGPEERCRHQGKPLPGIEIKIIDPESGRSLDADHRGEIVVRGPSVFDGYDQPESGDSGIDEHGWFRTGDLGVLDASGNLSFLGRLKDMLKVGGENVAAMEVESYLNTHPAIVIAQVVGVPDPKYGEVVAAFIELKPGAIAAEHEIIEYCLGQIARYKVPRYVRFVSQWPMSSTKIQKFKLRDELVKELGLADSQKVLEGRTEHR
jgi:acyl-CoA synthetase (AMP-forming)/AMP-acid ligase II